MYEIKVNVELEKDNKVSIFRNGVLARAQATFQGSGTETAEREAKVPLVQESATFTVIYSGLSFLVLVFSASFPLALWDSVHTTPESGCVFSNSR